MKKRNDLTKCKDLLESNTDFLRLMEILKIYNNLAVNKKTYEKWLKYCRRCFRVSKVTDIYAYKKDLNKMIKRYVGFNVFFEEFTIYGSFTATDIHMIKIQRKGDNKV